MRFLILFLITLTTGYAEVAPPLDLFAQYFEHFHIQNVRFLLCSNDETKTNLLKELSKKGFQISFHFDTKSDTPLQREGGVIDLTCDYGRKMLNEVSSVKMLNSHTEWLLLTDKAQDNVDLSKIYALPSSCVTLVKVSERGMELYEVWRASMQTNVRLERVSNLSISSELVLPVRQPRHNFHGAHLRSATVLIYPGLFDGFEGLNHLELDIGSKTCYPITAGLKTQLNFSTSLRIELDYGYTKTKDGKEGGLKGLILRDEVDFGAAGIFMREDRLTTIDFTGEVLSIHSEILFKQPSLTEVQNIFLLPFSDDVWLACSALASLVLGLLCLQSLFSGSFDGPLSVPGALLLIVASACQQGVTVQPRSGSAKSTVFAFSLAAIFLFTSYSANIVSLLQSTSTAIGGLEDLVQSRMTVKAQEIFYNQPMLKESKDPEVKVLYQKKILPQGSSAYISTEEGMKLVQTGHVAFKVETNWGYKIISEQFDEDEKCALGNLKVIMLPVLSIPVPKRSGYREIFTQKLAWQREAGLISREIQRRYHRKPGCSGNGRRYVNVSLTAVSPAFLILLYAAAISFLLLTAEHLTARLVNGKRELTIHLGEKQ